MVYEDRENEESLEVIINAKGEVISARHYEGEELTEKDYHEEEKKRLVKGQSVHPEDQGAILATENWCKWKKMPNGTWKCVPV